MLFLKRVYDDMIIMLNVDHIVSIETEKEEGNSCIPDTFGLYITMSDGRREDMGLHFETIEKASKAIERIESFIINFESGVYEL